MILSIMLSIGFLSCSSDDDLSGEDGNDEMLQQKYTDLKVAITMNAKDIYGKVLDRMTYDEKDMEIHSPWYSFEKTEEKWTYNFISNKRDSKYAPAFHVKINSGVNARQLKVGDKMPVESVFFGDILSNDSDTPEHGRFYEFSGEVRVVEIVKNDVVLGFNDFVARDIHNVDGKAHMTLTMNGKILYEEYISTNND